MCRRRWRSDWRPSAGARPLTGCGRGQATRFRRGERRATNGRTVGAPVWTELGALARILFAFDMEPTQSVVSEGHSPGVAQVVFQHRQQCSGVRKVI